MIFTFSFQQLKFLKSTLVVTFVKLEISHNMLLRKGFSLSFKIKRTHCDKSESSFTSPVINHKKYVNLMHSLMAFREIGCGRESKIRFANIMNMPPPMNYRNINRANDELHNAYQKAAICSMTFCYGSKTKFSKTK